MQNERKQIVNLQSGLRVVHRYLDKGWYTPKNAQAILLGTFPSVLIREAFGRVRQSDVDFFYGSRDNNFWPDLSIIYNYHLSYDRTKEAIQQRMQLLDKLHLGLSDAIFACTTLGSAMDTALQNIELNTGLIKTLDTHPSIITLYFTSSSGKVNAESLTLKILKDADRLSKMKIIQKSRPRMREFLFTDVNHQQRTIRTITLISPSPLAEQMAGIKPEQRRAQYVKHLPKLTDL
jgi:G:T/U-mismatch repair DNA glycosylase